MNAKEFSLASFFAITIDPLSVTVTLKDGRIGTSTRSDGEISFAAVDAYCAALEDGGDDELA